MPEFERQTIVDFSKGLNSSVNRFTRPPGTFPRVSNFLYERHGALRTTDGSLIQCSRNGAGATTGQKPWVYIVNFSPVGATRKLLGLQLQGGTASLFDITGKSWLTALASAACSSSRPSLVPANQNLFMALGRGSPIKFWDGTALNSLAANSWIGATALGGWVASTIYATGSVIAPGNGHIYTAVVGGVSGSGMPTFPTTTKGRVIDGQVTWQENGTATPGVPKGADFIFFHGAALYVWGNGNDYTTDPNLFGPDGLCASDPNDFSSWNPINAIFVGKGDGEVPMGGAVWTLSEAGIAATAQLVLFKQTSTYVLTGFLPNAQLNKAPTGVGCIAPGSIQFISELGVMRLTYRGFAVFDGQRDEVELYTDPIRNYIFGGVSGIVPIDLANANLSFATQCSSPRGYVCFCPLVGTGGRLVRGFFYDIDAQAWAIIDLPFALACAAYIPQNQGNPLLGTTLVGAASDGTIRRMFSDDYDWDGVPIIASVRTPSWGGVTTPMYVRRANVRAQASFPGSSSAALTGAGLNKMDRDGLLESEVLPVMPTQQVAATIDVGEKLFTADLDLVFQGQVTVEGIEWHYRREKPRLIDPTPTQQGVTNVVYQASGSQSIGAGLNNITVTLPSTAPNAFYALVVTPNWNTTWWVAAKTTTTFTVYFNTPAPGDNSGSFDYEALIAQ